MKSRVLFKTVRNLFAILLSIILILSGCSKITPVNNEINKDNSASINMITNAFNEEIKGINGYSLAAENDFMQIYVNGTTAEIKTINKITGAEWFSNPKNRESDPIAMGDNVTRLNSQFYITFIDGSNKSFNYYSKTDSVDYNQVSFQKISNGIRVNYIIGKNSSFYIFPAVISKNRMNTFLSKLSEEEKDEVLANYDLFSLKNTTDESVKKLLLQRYPTIAKTDLYIFKLIKVSIEEIKNIPDFVGQQLEELFKKCGYTKEDLKNDYIDNKFAMLEQTNPVFEIPVEYTLENSDLVARIPYKDIRFDTEKYYLTNITLLPFMGAADTSKKGFIFVPDGSGAIINLNNGKSNYQPYEKALYGRDKSIFLKKLNSNDNTQAYMPIFGLRQNDDAFLAVIEKGDAAATINADVSGRYSSFNSVNSSFNLTPNSTQTESVLNISGSMNFQDKPLQSDIQIRYIFLNGKDIDYTNMALQYQKYLLQNKMIEKQTLKEEIPLNINLLGAVKYNTSVLGFPVRATKVLTSYTQAKTILEQIKAGGVNNISLKYEGWSNAGITNSIANKVNLINELGEKAGLDKLIQYVKANDIDFYPDVNFEYITESGGFDSNTESARNLSNAIAYDYDYSLDLFKMIDDTILPRFIVSPSKYDKFLNSYFSSYKKLSLGRISLSNFGTDLNSDFHKNSQIDRQKSKDYVVSAMDKVKEFGFKISVDGANVYALKNASAIVNLPLDCGYSYIIDESIPFYQIVVHGIIPYAGKPMNTAADFNYETLKLIETGAQPYFEWTYANNSALKETDYNYYGLDYKLWLKDAISVYKKVNEAIGDCQNFKIIQHKQIQNGVYLTKYENGKTIYTNYNKNEIDINGVKVEPNNYMIVKEWKVNE